MCADCGMGFAMMSYLPTENRLPSIVGIVIFSRSNRKARLPGLFSSQAGQTCLMFAARGPFGLCSTSYCTLSCSLSVLKPLAWMAEKWTKRSLLPSSGVIKPKPLASLNHFTVPVLMFVLFLDEIG